MRARPADTPRAPAAETAAGARVTLRQIAARAGVSLATVSLALRDDPRITAATRARVRRATRELGYRPDPAVSAFMFNLRRRRPGQARANIAILPTVAELGPGQRPYAQAIRDGAAAQAASAGYTAIDVGLHQHGRRLGAALLARGVSGIVVLPLAEPTDLGGLLDWGKFSAVATSYSLVAPSLHAVLPHHFADIRRVVDVVQAAGCRRIGLLLSGANFSARVKHTSLAVLALHNAGAGAAAVPPLVLEGERYIPDALPGWLAGGRPDVILTNNAPAVAAALAALGRRVPRDLGLFSLGSSEGGRFACLDQHPDQIGREAVIRLISLMQRGEKGVPARPVLAMLAGTPVPGPSLRARGGARAAGRPEPSV